MIFINKSDLTKICFQNSNIYNTVSWTIKNNSFRLCLTLRQPSFFVSKTSPRLRENGWSKTQLETQGQTHTNLLLHESKVVLRSEGKFRGGGSGEWTEQVVWGTIRPSHWPTCPPTCTVRSSLYVPSAYSRVYSKVACWYFVLLFLLQINFNNFFIERLDKKELPIIDGRISRRDYCIKLFSN